MITVPQVWQLPQITHCCPGIGPLGDGVQKDVKGMEGAQVNEGVGSPEFQWTTVKKYELL